MNPSPAILYDGWALAYQSGSWEAIHLLSLLANLPTGVQASVALPAEPFESLPAGIESVFQPAKDKPWSRLRWEQSLLPALARSSRSDLLHLFQPRAALFGSTPQVISPAGLDSLFEPSSGGCQIDGATVRSGSLASRLRLALGQGGFSRAAGIFWPDDLPDPGLGSKLFKLPPVIHPKFADTIRESSLPELPETYILYHGPQTVTALHQLVEAWSWATGSIGEYYPLLVLGFDQTGSARLNALLEQSALKKTVSLLPPLTLEATAYLYQNCTAVFHPADIPPWGNPLRNALFFGKPLVALETPFSDALVGPAGYLVKPGKPDLSRALGAALITVIVEENVAANLAQAARQRAAGWENSAFSSALEAAYQVLLSSG